MRNNPLVSIITPSYNSIEWIKKTHLSINSQSYENWEWLITDDCSTDSSLLFLREISELDPRIKIFINAKNAGAAISRNNSLNNASGQFIAFIDSDDLWLPFKLEYQVNFMEKDNIDFSFTAYELINEYDEKLNRVIDLNNICLLSYHDMLQKKKKKKKATLGCSTVMIRKSAFDDITMPLIRTGQDYALWLKLLKTGNAAHKINEILTQYRIVPNSISRNKFKKAKRQWQIYREIENLPLLKSIECFCFYAWRAVFRK